MADISKITLPSGNTYDIKDQVARDMISGGITFNIVWTSSNYNSHFAPDAATLAKVPQGVTVYYNSGYNSAMGTLPASSDTKAIFYLIYSKTQDGNLDLYDEYVTLEPTSGTYTWEKIGDTLLDLSSVIASLALTGTTQSVITGVGASSTDTVLGTGSTFSVSGDNVNVVTGVSTTKAKATASGTAVSASGDNVTVVTGYASPSTDTFVKSVSAETNKNLVTTSITPAGAATSVVSGITDNTKYLSTVSLLGVQSLTTTASKATAATSQTTADGTGTASSTNTDWLKGVSVSNETLTIGAATMDTQTTTQFTFADVAVPIKDTNLTSVATGALQDASPGHGAEPVVVSTSPSTTNVATVGSAVTVATGSTSTTGTGDAVVTGVTIGSSGTALTGLGTASTDTVLGTGSTFSVTQPTVTLSTGSTGDITIATGSSGTDSVWGSSSTISASGDNVTAITGVQATGTSDAITQIAITPTMGDGTTGTPSTYPAAE